jgi:uncharacterized membrane protein YphA (DoxX/SURF4 family)
MKKTIIVEIICFLFILLFVYAALMKLRDTEEFVAQMQQSPLLLPFATWVAWVVPLTELAVAALLTIRRFRLIGLIASFTLMAMFTVYIIIIMNFADHVPCSCGGILSEMGWKEHLFFNIGFMLLAIAGTFLLVNLKGEKQSDQRVVIA